MKMFNIEIVIEFFQTWFPRQPKTLRRFPGKSFLQKEKRVEEVQFMRSSSAGPRISQKPKVDAVIFVDDQGLRFVHRNQ